MIMNLTEYKEGDIIDIISYKEPPIKINTMINNSYISFSRHQSQVRKNALIVKKVSDNEYIVAYVDKGEIIQKSITL